MANADNKGLIAWLVLSVLALTLLAYVGGIFAAIFAIYPTRPLNDLVQEIRAEMQRDENDGDLHFLYKERNSDKGVTVYREDAVQPGVTLVTGMWRDNDVWQPAIRLLDFDGTVLHEWLVRPQELWPDSPYEDWVAGSLNNPTSYVHGTWLLPDGDVVFNIEYLGMVRMNACGETIWKLGLSRPHHSIFRDDEGYFWASGLHWREQTIPEYAHLTTPFVDESMLRISPDGEVVRDISILKVLYDSAFHGILQQSKKKLDLTHMNDVEVLSAELADAFPMFNEGDIMVSLRNLNLVVVVDGETERVKWHFSHPLVRQHDPDFEPDGTIVIFDNNNDTTRDGSLWGQSRLLQINPADNGYTIAYPTSAEQPFYTQEGGKHQLLQNGNRLITEANTGRVFEVTPAGELVWNWVIEARDGEYLPEVLEGSRYPVELASFIDGLSCAL